MTLIALMIVPFAVSLLVCWLMIRYGPKDAPDGGRKTQAAPVPSSGGVGVVAGLMAGVAAMAMTGSPAVAQLALPPVAGVAAFTLFAAIVGWADDTYGLPAMTKLLALLAGAVVAVMLGPQPVSVWIGGAMPVPALIGMAGAVALIFVMANAVNFLDGANGIAMGTSMIILTMMGLLLAPNVAYSPEEHAPAMLMALVFAAAAAIGGFLFWNLPGKLFAGDAGALAIGGLIGGAIAMFAINGPVLVPLTLCLPILIDVFLTLAWRARHGRPLMQAHRDHAYQLLLRDGWEHGQVARLWWGMTVVSAGAVVAGPFAAAAGAYGMHPPPLDVIAFVAVLGIGCSLWVRQRVTLGRKLTADGR
jgi:UDP-GlcNAc:undecaprenyl-phosphate/decaprenyl-phosphate GlcNAc-1-phosphate transferase